ncbi:hypothetical protein ACFV3R_07585 [Streptomyces sp. NPDC059740]|uniref:hypothetical protein n=1 Tax=Streptomyces sp. NPDC059740 TaxID=3346926 RepID=UPI00365BE7D0
MTQSGQGGDPQNAARPVHEGVVLPAHGDPWVPGEQQDAPATQTWEQPQWNAEPGQPEHGQGGAQQPPAGYGYPGGVQNPTYAGVQNPTYAGDQGATYAGDQGATHGGNPFQPGAADASSAAQAYPGPPPQHPPAAPQQPPGGYHSDGYAGAQPGYGQAPAGPPPGAMPPVAGEVEATRRVSPFDPSAGSTSGGPGVPLPPTEPPAHPGQQPPQDAYHSPFDAPPQAPHAGPQAVDADATQLIPPFAGNGAPGASQPLPQASPAGPPPESPGESTTTLRRVQAPAPGGDAEATQYLPPVSGGTAGGPTGAGPMPPTGGPYAVRPGAPEDRPTPAEFDGLFRPDPVGGPPPESPASTQQMPRFTGPGAAHPAAPAPGPSYDQPYGQSFDPSYGQGADRSAGGGRRRVLPLAIIGVVVLAALGAGIGYLASSGDEEKKEPAAASSSAGGAGAGGGASKEASPSVDAAAQAQAKELDALLADSNNSRAAVITAVDSIRKCQGLDDAARKLNGAANQRKDLVDRLGKLQVDKVPDGPALVSALNQAWQASASADAHYAGWARQVKRAGGKGCKKGRAGNTGEYNRAVSASGTATQAKQQAAKAWNPIARKYGLTERQPVDL